MEGFENFVEDSLIDEDNIEDETADEFGEIDVAEDDEDPDAMVEDSFDDMDDF